MQLSSAIIKLKLLYDGRIDMQIWSETSVDYLLLGGPLSPVGFL